MVAVIVGLLSIRIAFLHNDGLVVDDYYKQGLEINRSFERDKAAARHGLKAMLQFDVERKNIHLYLLARSDYKRPNQLVLNFRHHTRSGFDKGLILERMGDELYQGTLPELTAGAWEVELVAADWRMVKSMKAPISIKELQIVPAL
jgi:hypothetical protein